MEPISEEGHYRCGVDEKTTELCGRGGDALLSSLLAWIEAFVLDLIQSFSFKKDLFGPSAEEEEPLSDVCL